MTRSVLLMAWVAGVWLALSSQPLHAANERSAGTRPRTMIVLGSGSSAEVGETNR